MPRRGEQGFALVAVLGVLAVLTTIVLSFGHRAVLERRAAAVSIDRTQVLNLARGAAMRGMVELRNKNVVDILRNQGERTAFDQQWYEPFEMFSGEEGIFALGGPIETEGEQAYYQMLDGESRVCINSAPSELLEGLDAVSLGIARKILLRRDENSRSETERRPQAYLSLEEFRTLERVRDDEWYGSGDEAGLRDVLTVWGDGKVNINTCSREVLEAIPGLGLGDIDKLIEYRAGEDEEVGTTDDRAFDEVDDVIARAGLSAASRSVINRFCKVTSDYFTITAVATQRQGAVRAQITATVQLGKTTTRTLEWREDLIGF